MSFKPRHLLLALVAATAMSSAAASNWIDGVSLTVGRDSNDNESKLLRAGLQNKWQRTWFNGGAWYMGGYWDTELAYMKSDIDNAKNRELFDLSLTPIFRMQRDVSLSSGVSPFAEAGIGPHLLSETRLGERSFSTALQLGSVLGLGLGFGDRGQYEVSYRFQHVGNLGIKQPNDGMDLHMLRFGYFFTR